MSDDESEAYDPAEPTAPETEPPRRSTAPQSEYTNGQVAIGFAVMLVGLVLVVGLTLALA